MFFIVSSISCLRRERAIDLQIVDQPVGTGFSIGNYRATNNIDDTDAFVHWLVTFFKNFPVLKSKKIHVLGESYSGIFVSPR